MEERLYWLALNKVPGVGPVVFRRLLDRWGSAKAVFEAPEGELRRVVGRRVARAIKEMEAERVGEEEGRRVQALGAEVLTLWDRPYPSNLRHIYDPPPVLYLKGRMVPQDDLAVAVVGSRRCSPYGRSFARRLSKALASHGVTVISGMATGIDTEAHLGALEAGGRTVAVLGSGLDRVYPPQNRGLFERIARQGAVLSEFPFGEPPNRWNFPLRNRLISGLSLGVVVVEAPSRSGALITASLALEQGRSVFAVPGYAGAVTSRGTHRLIKEGAKLVEEPEDILEELLPQYERGEPERGDLSEEERLVVELLQQGPLHIDELSRRSSFDVQRINSLLLRMELKGLILQMPGKIFALSR